MAWQLGGEEISSVNFCRHRVVKCGKKYRSGTAKHGSRQQRRRRIQRTGRRRRRRRSEQYLPLAPLHFRFTSPFRKSLSVPPSIPSSHPSTIFIDGCIRHKGGRGAADTDVDGPSQSSGRGWRKAKRQKSPYIGSCPASRPSSPDLEYR